MRRATAKATPDHPDEERCPMADAPSPVAFDETVCVLAR
jgi:hypothetical protein